MIMCAPVGLPFGYQASAVAYGAQGYALRGAKLTGIANSFYGTFFCMFRLDGSDGTAMDIVSDGASITVSRTAGNRILVSLVTVAGTATIQSSMATYTAGPTWYSLYAVWDTNHTAGNKVVRLVIAVPPGFFDVVAATTTDTAGASAVKYSVATDFALAASVGGSNNWNGALVNTLFAPGYFDTAEYVLGGEFTYYSGANKPIFLGYQGQLPAITSAANGTQTPGALATFPSVFLPNVAASAGINFGLGGNLTVTSAGGYPQDTTGP